MIETLSILPVNCWPFLRDISVKLLSYSLIPEWKVPETLNSLDFGKEPNGVTIVWVEYSLTFEPIDNPNLFAIVSPRIIQSQLRGLDLVVFKFS